MLLGRNGAGKTTTLRSIMGMTPPKSGKIMFKGIEITKLPTYKIAQMGVAYVPSKRRIFRHLTVDENIKLGFRGSESSFKDRLGFVLDMFPDLRDKVKANAQNLSGGQQKMLQIACALISSNELLLVDEPSEGLSPILIRKFAETLTKLREEITIILVEQNFKLARAIGDVCYILDMGRIVYRGSIEEVTENKEVLKRHLGVSI